MAQPEGMFIMDRVAANRSARNLDPYDRAKYESMAGAIEGFRNPQKEPAQKLATINNGAGYVNALDDLVSQMGNGNFQPTNEFRNKWRAMWGQEAPTDLEETANQVSGAIAKAEGLDQAAAKAKYNINASPAQLKSGLNIARNLIGNNIATQEQAYKNGTLGLRNDFETLLSPAAQTLRTARLGQQAPPGAVPGAAPPAMPTQVPAGPPPGVPPAAFAKLDAAHQQALPQALAHLKAHPETADIFAQHFGFTPGAGP
jgi:hypothetical protein